MTQAEATTALILGEEWGGDWLDGYQAQMLCPAQEIDLVVNEYCRGALSAWLELWVQDGKNANRRLT